SIMADPQSPDHVFEFLGNDPTLDVEEDPEEEQDMDVKEDVPPVVASPAGSLPISPPPLLESSSDSDTAVVVTADRADTKTLYGSVKTLTRDMETRRTEITIAMTGVDWVRRRMDAFDVDIAFIEQATVKVEDDVVALQARAETAEARLL
ncbi:hypothetical protein Tco_0386703, partial [Tanacetum coccineum]